MKSRELMAACLNPGADTYMLYDLTLRLEGGMHEVTNGFWSCENRHVMQPLYKANKQYESLTREYLSNIHIDELDSPALSARNRAK